MKKVERNVLVVNILSILLSSYIGYRLGKISEIETRKFATNKEVFIEVLSDVTSYSDYFTVDWEKLSEFEYTLYRCPGLDLEKYDLNNYPAHCDTYDLLNKAKADFHRSTTKARILGTERIREALNNVEGGFDEVLDIYFSRGYYLRALGDAYQEVMPAKFEELEKTFREELTN